MSDNGQVFQLVHEFPTPPSFLFHVQAVLATTEVQRIMNVRPEMKNRAYSVADGSYTTTTASKREEGNENWL
jgi:hypothetical protein